MKIIELVFFLSGILPLICCSVTSRASSDELDDPTQQKVVSQTNYWSSLANDSDLIAIGHVVDIFYVVDEAKLYENKTITNGIVPLPNLKDGVKGVLLSFRTEEIIFSKVGKKAGEIVNVYVEDGYQIPADSSIPRLLPKKRYIVFLKRIKKSDEYVGRTVIQPRDLAKGGTPFEYEKAFVITNGRNGYLKLIDSNQQVISDVRRAIKKLE